MCQIQRYGDAHVRDRADCEEHEISDEERVKSPFFAVRPRSPSRRSLGCRLVPYVIPVHRTCGQRRWTGAHYDAQLGWEIVSPIPALA
jgi:hypothetical protein